MASPVAERAGDATMGDVSSRAAPASSPVPPVDSTSSRMPPAVPADVAMGDAGDGRGDARLASPAEVPIPPMASTVGPDPFGELHSFDKDWPHPNSRPCAAVTRWEKVDPRRMAGVWTTYCHLYPDLHEVPIGTPTDYPELLSAGGWKLAHHLDEVLSRPPLLHGAMPVFDMDYDPGSLPVFGESPRGYYLRQALAENRHGRRHGICACAEQREVECFSSSERLELCPVVPTW